MNGTVCVVIIALAMYPGGEDFPSNSFSFARWVNHHVRTSERILNRCILYFFCMYLIDIYIYII